MATISSPAACAAVAAALLLSGIGGGLPIDTARADDNCISAPGAAAPEGQHWYCWYLYATALLPNDAAVKPLAASSKPAPSQAINTEFAPQNTEFALQPPAGTSNLPRGAAPHVTILNIKTVAAPFVDASASQAAAPEKTDEPPMPQISPSNANAPVDADAKPASGLDPATAPAAIAHNSSEPVGTAAKALGRTQTAYLIFLLALAFGISAALVALFSGMVGRRRRPRLSDYPEDGDGVIHQGDAALLAPLESHGSAELDGHTGIEQLPAPSEPDEPGQSEQVKPALKDIELALRALRQARESIAQN